MLGIAVGCRSMACHARFGTHSAWQQPPREATRALCYSWLLDAFTSECQDDLVGLREGRVLALTSTLVSVPCSPCFCACSCLCLRASACPRCTLLSPLRGLGHRRCGRGRCRSRGPIPRAPGLAGSAGGLQGDRGPWTGFGCCCWCGRARQQCPRAHANLPTGIIAHAHSHMQPNAHAYTHTHIARINTHMCTYRQTARPNQTRLAPATLPTRILAHAHSHMHPNVHTCTHIARISTHTHVHRQTDIQT